MQAKVKCGCADTRWNHVMASNLAPTNPRTLCHCVDLHAAATGVQGQVWASASVESGLKSCARNACCVLDDVTWFYWHRYRHGPGWYLYLLQVYYKYRQSRTRLPRRANAGYNVQANWCPVGLVHLHRRRLTVACRQFCRWLKQETIRFGRMSLSQVLVHVDYTARRRSEWMYCRHDRSIGMKKCVKHAIKLHAPGMMNQAIVVPLWRDIHTEICMVTQNFSFLHNENMIN